MSYLLRIPMESLLSYQDRSSTFDAILGHIPSFSYGDDRYLADLLQFSSLGREILYLLYWSLFLWFSSRWAFSGAWRSWSWLSHYTWPYSRLFWWDRGSYPSGLFSWDSLLDYSFEMMVDPPNRAFWVRGVRLIVILRQALWSSRIGCEAMCIVDLTISTC